MWLTCIKVRVTWLVELALLSLFLPTNSHRLYLQTVHKGSCPQDKRYSCMVLRAQGNFAFIEYLVCTSYDGMFYMQEIINNSGR